MSFDYKEWWKHQGDAVKQRRRKKYQSDPEYREKQKQWSADYRERQRKRAPKKFRKKQREWAQRYRERSRDDEHQGRRPVIVTVETDRGKVALRCWTVGRLASEVGRTVDFIDMLERRAQLPESPLRSEEGYRYYTDEMIQGVKRVLRCRRRVRKTDVTLYFEVLHWWNKSGAMDAHRVLGVNAADMNTGG